MKASQVFERWGYEFIRVPIFESWEDQRETLGERSKSSLVFKDTRTGELLALRADFTTQVLRTVSKLRSVELPLRLYYFGPVVSQEGESFHTGIELIGVSSLEGDAEVIAAVCSFLKELGLKDFKVSVGHVGVVEKVLSSVEDKEAVRKAFLEKDISFLRRRFGSSPFSELPLMQGDEGVLELLDGMGLGSVKEELREVGRMLSSAGVDFFFDLSEIRELPYYTGIVFEVFHPSLGSPVAGGGRYDKLSRMFGSDLPSTGGTVYVDRVIEVLGSSSRAEKDVFVVDLSGEGLGFEVASSLRSRGLKVGRDMVRRDLEESLDYAFGSGYRLAVVVLSKERVRVYRTREDFSEVPLDKVHELVEIL